MTITAAFLGLFLTLGCTDGGSGEALPEGTCDNTTDCPEGSICLGDTCKVAECTDSVECEMEQYCNAAFSCVPGCNADSDCSAGFECDTTSNTCVEYGCRDTDLDCNYGEICDTTSGTCNYDDRGHCETCSITQPNSCGGNAECVAFSSTPCQTTADCEQGEICDQFTTGRYCHADYCLIKCDPSADDAPRGFTCMDVYGDRSLIAYVGDCDWLQENGMQ